MRLDPDSFRSALGRFASGVTVVTTCAPTGADHGMTASAFCSVSLEPPLILVCIEKIASMHDPIVTCAHFAINVLEEAQELLARHFAEADAPRFDGVGFSRGANGSPVLDDALAVLECRRAAAYDAGDHTIVVGEVESASWRENAGPLLYYRGGYASLHR